MYGPSIIRTNSYKNIVFLSTHPPALVNVVKECPLTTSNEFQFVTDGEKPGGPPKNVRITGLTSTNLEVTWDDPDQRLQHGIVTRYNLGYREYK